MKLHEIIGWLGAIIFIIAYFLLSIKILRASGILYHLLNAIGGLCLVINATYLHDNPTLAVNLVWMGIAIVAMLRNVHSSKKSSAIPE